MPRYIGSVDRVRAPAVATPLAAQQNATVQGTVVDESRGVLPGVTVTATEINTGRQSIAVTSEDGRYRLENLPPGRYKLRIELPGFATAEIADIELLVGANATVPPVTMKVAALEETVTVSGAGAARRRHARRRWPATSTAARWRSCRCRAATGRSCR